MKIRLLIVLLSFYLFTNAIIEPLKIEIKSNGYFLDVQKVKKENNLGKLIQVKENHVEKLKKENKLIEKDSSMLADLNAKYKQLFDRSMFIFTKKYGREVTIVEKNAFKCSLKHNSWDITDHFLKIMDEEYLKFHFTPR